LYDLYTKIPGLTASGSRKPGEGGGAKEVTLQESRVRPCVAPRFIRLQTVETKRERK